MYATLLLAHMHHCHMQSIQSQIYRQLMVYYNKKKNKKKSEIVTAYGII
jgi:hypothetical protein